MTRRAIINTIVQIKYITFADDGSIKKMNLKYRKNSKRGSLNNHFLKERDLVFLGNGLFSYESSGINEITFPFQGLYSTYMLIELISE